MALFSRLRGGSAPKQDTTIARAVLAPAVLTMAADGSVDDAEIAQLNNLCGFSPIFASLEPAVVTGLVKDILKEISAGGADKLITEVGQTLSPGLCETAFCFAMRVAMADGSLDDNERNVLAGSANRLNLSDAAFEKIVEVVAMMQRPPTA